MKLREKTTVTLLIAIIMISAMILVIPAMAKKKGNTIQSGLIKASTGETLTVGYDEYGYNYQAHMFNGIYSDYDRQHGGPYSDVGLIMKWNDAWLSNMDRDNDELLDRHWGHTSYSGSGAWLTNHQWGIYEDGSHWSYFTKIVAVPIDAYVEDGIWYSSDGAEIGPVLWGAFATILSVEKGILYHSPSPVGFGYYQP